MGTTGKPLSSLGIFLVLGSFKILHAFVMIYIIGVVWDKV